jgi:RNA polymerase sigma factor (sigma-70 family)
MIFPTRWPASAWRCADCAGRQHGIAGQLPEPRVRFWRPSETISPVTCSRDYEAQFTELLQAYAAPIRRLCAVYADSGADREDLFQDIFLAVWRSLPGFRHDASVRTWLYRVAHNVALTWRVRHRRRRSRESPLIDDTAAPPDMDLRRLALTRAIAAMSPGDRTLTLLWLEGLSAVEIEDVTGVKAGTVAVRLSRIRKHLQPVEGAS